MSDIRDWATEADLNNEISPNGWPEGMPPSDVNNSAREMMAAMRRSYIRQPWYAPGGSIVRVSENQITIKDDAKVSNYSQYYSVGQRVRIEGAEYTVTGFVSSILYEAPTTTIEFGLDAESVLPPSILEVYLGLNSEDVQGVTGPNLLGCIIGFTDESSKIGAGLLLANGQKFNPHVYPDLAKLYYMGTNSLGTPNYRYGGEFVGDEYWPKRPDVRGYFPRFLDERIPNTIRNNVDPDIDRVVGSKQEDSYKLHHHNLRVKEGLSDTGDPSQFPAGSTFAAQASRGLWSTSSDAYNTKAITSAGSEETRPKNIAVVGVIVAYGGVIAGGLADVSEVLEDVKTTKALAESLSVTIENLGDVMRYCGSVDTYAALPTEDNQVGDVYNVLDTGANYSWTSAGVWDEFGGGAAKWGSIEGDITQQADLQEVLAGKANITDIPDVPTKTSELENDSGFITADDMPQQEVSAYNSLSAEQKSVLATEGTYNGEPVEDGEIFTSYEGKFIKAEAGTATDPVSAHDVAYYGGFIFGHGGRLIALAHLDNYRTAQYSDNHGDTWTTFNDYVIDMQYSPGAFFTHNGSKWLVACRQIVRSSIDGINWGAAVTVTSSNITHLSSVNGRFFVIAGAEYYYSDDGAVWTKGTLPVSSASILLCSRKNDVVLVCDNNKVYTSPNGVEWSDTGYTYPSTVVAGRAYYICGKVLFMTSNGSFASSDLNNWQSTNVSVGDQIASVSSDFAVKIGSSDSSTFFTTTDGVLWTQKSLPGKLAKNNHTATTGDGYFYFSGAETPKIYRASYQKISLESLSYNKEEVDAAIAEATPDLTEYAKKTDLTGYLKNEATAPTGFNVSSVENNCVVKGAPGVDWFNGLLFAGDPSTNYLYPATTLTTKDISFTFTTRIKTPLNVSNGRVYAIRFMKTAEISGSGGNDVAYLGFFSQTVDGSIKLKPVFRFYYTSGNDTSYELSGTFRFNPGDDVFIKIERDYANSTYKLLTSLDGVTWTTEETYSSSYNMQRGTYTDPVIRFNTATFSDWGVLNSVSLKDTYYTNSNNVSWNAFTASYATSTDGSVGTVYISSGGVAWLCVSYDGSSTYTWKQITV